MYQKDVEILEKYADEAAAEYNANPQPEKQKFEPRGKRNRNKINL